MKEINLNKLIVTHCTLRVPEQISQMTDFTKGGGVFSTESLAYYAILNRIRTAPPIHISQFPDQKRYIHDGHHRAVSIWLSGRRNLKPSEYIITEWKSYKDYTDIVFNHPDGSWMGWVTPFDPRIEVRRPNFYQFKKKIKDIYDQRGAEFAFYSIIANRQEYVEQRKFFNVEDLVNTYRPKEIFV